MNNILKICLLLEEEEDEEFVVLHERFRNSPKNMLLKRRIEGCYETLIKKRLVDSEEKFLDYFQVSREIFNKILMGIEQDITDTQPTTRNRIHTISTQEKLCLTLRFLATGESYRSLSFQFRISHNWICKIVPKVLESICGRLSAVAIPEPTEDDFKRVAEEYWLLWNFPNCIGVIDGKHVRITCQHNRRPSNYNNKEFVSSVLFAVIDANCKFIIVDIGSYGKESDAGIFMKSSLFNMVQNRQLNIPPPAKLPKSDTDVPYVFLGDDTFSLTNYIMKPYSRNHSSQDRSKRIYNYRHNRARSTSEKTFGILCQCFRIFFSPIAVNPGVVDNLIMSACIIHNMMGSLNVQNKTTLEIPTANMIPMARMPGRNYNVNGPITRNLFKEYFSSDKGSVSWQNDEVR